MCHGQALIMDTLETFRGGGDNGLERVLNHVYPVLFLSQIVTT